MEIGILLLLILVLCALIVLILQLKNQQTNSLQMMMKSQESATHTQDISHQFDHILQQIQNLRRPTPRRAEIGVNINSNLY